MLPEDLKRYGNWEEDGFQLISPDFAGVLFVAGIALGFLLGALA